MNGGQILPSQNLINRVRKEPEVVRAGYYKPIIFDALGILLALTVGYFYRSYLDSQSSWVAAAIGAFVFLIFSSINALMPRSAGRVFFTICLEVVGLVAFFYVYSLNVLLIIGIAAILIIFWGYTDSRSELGNILEIKFSRAIRPVLMKTTTALAFLMVALYMPRWDARSIFISPESFGSIYNSVAGLANKSYPEIDFSSTFQNFAESIARLEFKSNSTFKEMPTAAQKQTVKQAASQIASDLSKSLGISIGPGEKTSNVFYDFILSKLRGWQTTYQSSFLIGWAIAALLILRSLGTVVYWMGMAVSFIIYEILISLGVIHIVGESRTHEVIEF